MLSKYALSICLIAGGGLAAQTPGLIGPSATTGKYRFLEQGGRDEIRHKFWFVDQGSRIMPLNWFERLERAGSSQEKFSQNLERFGFIPDDLSIKGDLNKAKLPIGFTVSESGEVGLNCAACHTGLISHGNKNYMIEGAPSMLNFDLFLSEMVDAMEDTVKDAPKGKRFFDGFPPDANDSFCVKLSKLRQRREINTSKTKAGFARVDAFGHIFNQVIVEHLGNPPSASHEPNAPASYPALWDIAQHDYVQWNYSAPNLGVGREASGSLIRNVGEVLGVFGTVKITGTGSELKYESSIQPKQLDNLREIESWIADLRSPGWPFSALTDLEKKKGKDVYRKAGCERCHKLLLDPSKPKLPFPAVWTSQSTVKTDRQLAWNVANIKAPSNILKGAPVKVNPCFPLLPIRSRQLAVELTGHLAASLVPGGSDLLKQAYDLSKACIHAVLYPPGVLGYKARPLNGIWATAPFLHNGSVPNLWELLQPEAKRISVFCVGDGKYDTTNVGYQTYKDQVPNCPPRASLVDTTKKGSKNVGHNFGINLSDDEKRLLIHFLKSL